MTTRRPGAKRLPRLALLTNPNARRMRRPWVRAALTAQAQGLPAVTTTCAADVPGALSTLLDEAGADTLAIAGGDGTLHHVVNALLRRPQRPLPTLVPLCGGTLNIVARTVGSRHDPARTLSRLRTFVRAKAALPPPRTVPLLAVETEDRAPVAGFVFGSETLYHAIELYGRFGSGYVGLARFLTELARGAAIGSALWEREGWKLGPHGTALRVDGHTYPTYTAVVASTVDLSLAVWAIRAIRRAPGATGCHAKVVLEQDPRALVAQVPGLMSERSVPGVRDHLEARALDLEGPFTLDGELFATRPAGGRPRARLRVTILPEVLRLVGAR